MHHHQRQQRVIEYYLMNIYLCEDSYVRNSWRKVNCIMAKNNTYGGVWTKTEDNCDLALEIT
jgi:hypothetical protein